MIICRTINELRQAIRQHRSSHLDSKVGFVPTMGYLHRGHGSLLERARDNCSLVVLSIFVNPLQFGPNEDFERYPRDEKRDLEVAQSAGTDIVFLPQVAEMYPTPTKTVITVSGVTERLCGASRPGHFDGVATVVSKLLNIVQPDFAYFGMKDAQQVAVIEQMVYDLNMPVTIVPCPTLREEDGLALSSRNVYLSDEERRQAIVLSAALADAEALMQDAAGLTPDRLQAVVVERIQSASLAHIDYAEVLSYPSLEPIDSFEGADRIIVALAVKFGKTRLIDNRILHIPA
ncbi:pantoate--beta-alanine ligase [Paenibacillus allorhizosphaerae]|uniref:Pantothenate synthetase n=1 Tax=Paenibacillus allorhizosphaerae TaxID=2849866 RepID=A0ABN7TNM9_9BACL|nr:pantoate--beta-alanine ligase [Paenibacillus allorhizosphaerae]CAG7648799.1 Pantothenate synthetase [Paenibacillus allorhizosphaerae]